nr:uncharacterized protein LOC119187145 [Rhipicephalus microplus]
MVLKSLEKIGGRDQNSPADANMKSTSSASAQAAKRQRVGSLRLARFATTTANKAASVKQVSTGTIEESVFHGTSASSRCTLGTRVGGTHGCRTWSLPTLEWYLWHSKMQS